MAKRKKQQRKKWKLSPAQRERFQQALRDGLTGRAWHIVVAFGDLLPDATPEEVEQYALTGARLHHRTSKAGPGRPKPLWYEMVRDKLRSRHVACPDQTYPAVTYGIATKHHIPLKHVRYHTRDLRW